MGKIVALKPVDCAEHRRHWRERAAHGPDHGQHHRCGIAEQDQQHADEIVERFLLLAGRVQRQLGEEPAAIVALQQPRPGRVERRRRNPRGDRRKCALQQPRRLFGTRRNQHTAIAVAERKTHMPQVLRGIDLAQRCEVCVDPARRAVLERIQILEQSHLVGGAALLALDVELRAPQRKPQAGGQDQQADRDDAQDDIAGHVHRCSRSCRVASGSTAVRAGPGAGPCASVRCRWQRQASA